MSGEKERRRRIAIFHCGFVCSGGGERIVLEEVMGLRRLGHEVACFAPTLDKEMAYPDFIEEVGVKTFLPSFWVICGGEGGIGTDDGCDEETLSSF